MSLEQDIIRGADAQALLENPVLKQAFERVEQYVDDQAYSCDPNDKERAAHIITAKQLVRAVQREIMRVVEDGEVAKIQIAEIEKRSRMRVFMR